MAPPPPIYPHQVYGDRYPRETRPSIAFVFSLIGGIFILLNGLVILSFQPLFDLIGLPLWIMAALGLVFGLAVILAAIMLYAYPSQRAAWGSMVIVFSVVSIVIGGGFFLGMLLGLVGGILAFIWNP